MAQTTKHTVNEALLIDACNSLRSTIHTFVERAQLRDVRGMLERGVLVQKQMERIAEIVTGTGVAP